MRKFYKAAVCLLAVICLVFSACTVAFAQGNKLKAVAYVIVDENGVKVDGIARSEQALVGLGLSYNTQTKTLTLLGDINCNSPVGVFCDLEGLLITTNGKHAINVYGSYTLEGKSENYGIYINKTAVFDSDCELDICARDLDKSVAKTGALDNKEVTVFESYGVYANAPVTFRSTEEMTVKSGNVGDNSAASAKSCAIAGDGQKSVVGKVRFVAGNVTVAKPENGISKAVEGEIIGTGNATAQDGVIYTSEMIYTTSNGLWTVISTVEFIVIIAAAVWIVILIRKPADKKASKTKK